MRENVATAIRRVNSLSDISARYTAAMSRITQMQKIIDRRFAGNQAAFAKAIKRAPSVVWQYLSGHRDMGEKFAQHIERCARLPKGWMDSDLDIDGIFAQSPTATGLPVGQYNRCHIVGTAQLGDGGYWHELDYAPGDGDGYIDVPSADPNAYALRVRGDSMAPAIRDGWYVVIEPSGAISPGEYVMVKTTDGRCMVKELLWERGDQIVLMSVNEQHGRLTLRRDEIEKIHHVAFIAPPSKRFP